MKTWVGIGTSRQRMATWRKTCLIRQVAFFWSDDSIHTRKCFANLWLGAFFYNKLVSVNILTVHIIQCDHFVFVFPLFANSSSGWEEGVASTVLPFAVWPKGDTGGPITTFLLNLFALTVLHISRSVIGNTCPIFIIIIYPRIHFFNDTFWIFY